MLPTLLCGSLLAFTPLAPLRAPVRTRTSAVKCVAPLDTAMLQLAEEGGDENVAVDLVHMHAYSMHAYGMHV